MRQLKWRCYRLDLLIPSFFVRDFTSAEILLSFLLPPPRTVLSLLARGLGELLGVSGETEVMGRKYRDVLSEAVEMNSLAFVRPTSLLFRTTHTWSVKAIEKEWITEYERLRDAVPTQLITTNSLSAYFFVDVNGLLEYVKGIPDKRLEPSNVEEMSSLISSALWLCRRLGTTESFCSPSKVRELGYEEVGAEAELNTSTPADWVQPLSGNWVLEESYPSMLMLGKSVTFTKSRREKALFLHPLKRRVEAGRVIYEVYEPSFFLAGVAKPKLTAVRVEDGTTCILQR